MRYVLPPAPNKNSSAPQFFFMVPCVGKCPLIFVHFVQILYKERGHWPIVMAPVVTKPRYSMLHESNGDDDNRLNSQLSVRRQELLRDGF